MERKIIFFDIDGTLVSDHTEAPEDTREAIELLRRNGHIPVVCTGRAKRVIYVRSGLDKLNISAQICAAGGTVIYEGETIYEETISRERLAWTMELLHRAGCNMIFEGPVSLHYLPEQKPALYEQWGELLNQKDVFHPFDMETSIVQKMMASDIDGLYDSPELEELRTFYNVLFYEDRPVVELIPLTVSKATGIQRLLDHLGASIEDTYAFGDGPNDMEMLRYVRYGVAMGNADQRVKDVTPYVTEGCTEGGIYNALKRFGLI